MLEKLCLKWNDFQANVNTAFGSLRHDSDYSDVTLACEDGEQVEAHKVILAASSPFFNNLLKQNKHPHPLIYMRGVKSEDLVAIVDFLYYGEANVHQESIDEFLVIAEQLKLKGFAGNRGNEIISEEPVKKYKLANESPSARKGDQLKLKLPKHEDPLNLQGVGVAQKENYETIIVNIKDIQELEEKVKSLMSKSENIHNGCRASRCTTCGKEGGNGAIKDHIEANHLEGVSLPCKFCEKTFRSRAGLRQHTNKHHI